MIAAERANPLLEPVSIGLIEVLEICRLQCTRIRSDVEIRDVGPRRLSAARKAAVYPPGAHAGRNILDGESRAGLAADLRVRESATELLRVERFAARRDEDPVGRAVVARVCDENRGFSLLMCLVGGVLRHRDISGAQRSLVAAQADVAGSFTDKDCIAVRKAGKIIRLRRREPVEGRRGFLHAGIVYTHIVIKRILGDLVFVLIIERLPKLPVFGPERPLGKNTVFKRAAFQEKAAEHVILLRAFGFDIAVYGIEPEIFLFVKYRLRAVGHEVWEPLGHLQFSESGASGIDLPTLRSSRYGVLTGIGQKLKQSVVIEICYGVKPGSTVRRLYIVMKA